MNRAEWITALGRAPVIAGVLRFLAHRYVEGSVVTLRCGVAAGMRWRRHHRYVNGYWIGHYELPIQEALRGGLRPGQVFFDVGANAGFFTLVAAKLVGPQGKCVAFDPLPENIQSVRQQIELNALGYCQGIQEAVGACEGTAEFSYSGPGDSMGHFATGESGKQSLKVTVTTLDRAMERFGRPDFIKMDIEGAEVDALAGAERVLKEARP